MRVFWFSTTFRIEKEKVAEEEDERKKVLQGKLELLEQPEYSSENLHCIRPWRHWSVGCAQCRLSRFFVLFFLFFTGRHLLGLTQRVHSNGQEHVEQGVIAEHGQKYEVKRINQTRTSTPLGLDALIHDLIPILAR